MKRLVPKVLENTYHVYSYKGQLVYNYTTTPTPKLKHAMKRKSWAYTNGERIIKKNITLYVIKLKPYIMWKIKRELANAKKSGMREEKPKN